MRKHLPVIFLLITLISWQNLYSGTNRFSGDPLLFAEEITSYMGSSLSENQSRQLAGFSGYWNSEGFRQDEMPGIIHIANLLSDRNARPVPHMLNYLATLSHFIEHDTGRRHLGTWKKALSHYLTESHLSLQRINEFIVQTGILISENILYGSGAISWHSATPDFSFIFNDSLTIAFPEARLKGMNHIDTLVIHSTSGLLDPLSMVWYGNGGRVTWKRAGYDENDTWALLGDYVIDLRRSEYHADSALLNFSRYFDSPVAGKLTDRVMTSANPENSTYPRFTSYRQEFSIREIYPAVDFEGGLRLHGARLIGSGGDDGNARLIFYREGEQWLTAESGHFVFSSQGVSSLNATVLFCIENDTVFHPNLHMNYNAASGELSLNQNDRVISRSPWYNGYHQVDMSFSRLLWKTGSPVMYMTMPLASAIGNATFKSLNYFDRNHYHSLQGMDAGHPLLMLRNFSARLGVDEFSAEEYARYIRKPVAMVRHQLLGLTLEGFLFYDSDTDLIRIRQKLNDYLQANIRRIDYDVIEFTSTTETPLENAALDIESGNMKIHGIPRVFLSNTQNVSIFPSGSKVSLQRNRNFSFDGNVNAGYLGFYGTTFTFDYDSFYIDLRNIDSVRIHAQLDEIDMYGRARLATVKSLIRTVTGELFIDKPFNKSGRVENPSYPKFHSTENSYVFYDHHSIHGGLYSGDNFYFALYPFLMDSLNTFRNEDLRFRGKLVSADIFPDIEEILILQDDFSLGIKHKAPESGLPAYGGRGRYFNNIRMSNGGLQGEGRLDFLTSTIWSEDFLFLPDSMLVSADEFLMAEQKGEIQFPYVTSANNRIRWRPYEDRMTVLQTGEPFRMFHDMATLDGSIDISSAGLTGSGKLRTGNAGIRSDKFTFRASSLETTGSRFTIHDPEKSSPSLSAENLGGMVDFRDRRAEFHAGPGSSPLLLPLSGFIANPDYFVWEMDNEKIGLFSQPRPDSPGTEYISSVRRHDSLRFFSPRAVLDLAGHTLTAGDVEFIRVADARIFPADSTLIIEERGDIRPLFGARITAGTNKTIHEIYDAGLTISSSREYGGQGYYDYIDEAGNAHPIYFDRISARNGETVASGKIGEGNGFMLSPAFDFAGEAGLDSSNPHLNFKGTTRIIHGCGGLHDNRLSFETRIDPSEILIPVADQVLSGDRRRLLSGIVVATDSVHIYPAFLTERRNWADQPVVSAEGYMKFDEPSGEYRIGSAEKIRDPGLPGNFLSLNINECILRGEGELQLGVDMGQVRLKAAGSATNLLNVNETSIDAMLSVDFHFSENALELLAARADSIPAPGVDPPMWKLNSFLGPERAARYHDRGSRRQERLPEELSGTIVISHVMLNWNKESRSYVSDGLLGIAYINGVEINKMFKGHIEITKRRSGDFMDLYIELEENNWYYFGYTRGTMQASSSCSKFTGIIGSTSLRHRRDRNAGERYIYMLATESRLEQFFRNLNRHTD